MRYLMVFQVTVNAMDARYYVDIPSRNVFFIWHMYKSYLFSTLSCYFPSVVRTPTQQINTE